MTTGTYLGTGYLEGKKKTGERLHVVDYRPCHDDEGIPPLSSISTLPSLAM